MDLKQRLIRAYKNLFKIGINLCSRSNFASLLFQAEKKLKEMLEVDSLAILVIDHSQRVFFKLNYDAINDMNVLEQLNSSFN